VPLLNRELTEDEKRRVYDWALKTEGPKYPDARLTIWPLALRQAVSNKCLSRRFAFQARAAGDSLAVGLGLQIVGSWLLRWDGCLG
jgi:hypothetical protein